MVCTVLIFLYFSNTADPPKKDIISSGVHSFCTLQELATAVQELQSRQHTIEMDHLKACFLEQGKADSVSDSSSALSGDTRASNAEISANKKHIRELLGTKCMVCGSENDVVVAHILKKASHCKSFSVAYYDKNSKDMSNWLMLCGTRGKVNACHHLFESYKMGFYVKDNHWYAYGGVKDGAQVTLRSNPHRTVLQAHLALVIKNLEEANEAVLAWSKDVSQSTPPAHVQCCNTCRQYGCGCPSMSETLSSTVVHE